MRERRPGFKSLSLAVWPWGTALPSPSLSFLACLIRQLVRFTWAQAGVKERGRAWTVILRQKLRLRHWRGSNLGSCPVCYFLL